MTNLSVIILVGREELHIRRCLERLAPLEPRQVLVVESQKGDRTHEIAIETAKNLRWQTLELTAGEHPPLNAHRSTLITIFHAWPGTQARQFNWALDALGENEKCEEGNEKCGEWILRLDADEYLTPETIEKLAAAKGLAALPDSVAGLTLELKRRFCGGEIRHATNGIRQVRLFRRGMARYDEGLMDERLVVDGENGAGGRCAVEDFPGAFYDDSLMPMDEWRAKHRAYAKREAAQAIRSMELERASKDAGGGPRLQGVWTDPRKATYYRLPRYFRAFAYFCIRYFLKGGFLDGYAGWMWNFWQGLWYRWIVDREIAMVPHLSRTAENSNSAGRSK